MNNANLIEQRSEVRMHLYYYIKVYDTKTDRLIGHIVDISSNGALLATTERLEENTSIELALEDSLDLDPNSKIHITAECRWLKTDEKHGLHDAGLRFTELSSQAKELIQILH